MNEVSRSSQELSFDDIAELFVNDLRAGKHPSISSYKERFPAYVSEIDDLFPMLCELEGHQTSESRPVRKLDVDGVPDRLGEYEIVREIGRGGMGVVYEARHAIMQRRVALKVLPRSFSDREHFLHRFMREARSAGSLHHTNIVPVFEIGEHEGIYFYAMQYIDGQNLDVVIDELRRIEQQGPVVAYTSAGAHEPGGAMTMWNESTKLLRQSEAGIQTDVETVEDVDPTQTTDQLQPERPQQSPELSQVGDARDSFFRRTARVGIQVAEALDFAHQHGLLHRDIKPSNLILDTNGVVWITDFGLAKNDGEDLTHTGDIVGTLRYMAPERFQGKADRRSDLYSLGLTLYELCTLEHAFDAPDRAELINQVMNHTPRSLRRIRAEIPRDLETVIVKAMAREPDSRYETAGDMAADLRRYVAGKPVQARRASVVERVWRWGKRHPSHAALALTLVVLCLTLMAGSLYFGYKERQHSTRLGIENARARIAEEEARAAEKEATDSDQASRGHLFWSYYNEGEAQRGKGAPGQRTDALTPLAKAYQVLSELKGLSDHARIRRQLAVRAQAIAALATWDVESTKTIPASGVWTAGMATDFANSRYAVLGLDGKIEIRDLESDEPGLSFKTSGERSWGATFSPDGRFLMTKHHAAFKNHEAEIYVWGVGPDLIKPVLLVSASGNHVSAKFCFSTDSTLAAITEKDGVSIFSTTDGSLVKKIPLEFDSALVHFANGNRELILLDPEDRNRIQFWSIDSASLVKEVTCSFEVSTIEWHDHYQQLIAGGTRLIAVWPRGDVDADPWESIVHGSSVRRIYLRPQGDLLVSYGWDKVTRVTDMASMNQVLQIKGDSPAFSGFSSDGRICFVTPEGGCGVWKFSDFRSLTILRNQVVTSPQKVTFHPVDSRFIGIRGTDGIEIWNHKDNQRMAMIPGESIQDWAFAVDGQSILVCDDSGVYSRSFQVTIDGTAIEVGPMNHLGHAGATNLQIDSMRQVVVSRKGQFASISQLNGDAIVQVGPHDRLSEVELSPCGRFVATTTWKGKGVRIWDAASGDLLHELVADRDSVKIAFGPDGKRFAATAETKRWVWDTDSWKTLVERDRDEVNGSVGAVTWSHDGRLIASEYNLNQPQLFLAETGRTVAVLEPTSHIAVGDLAFSRDSEYLAVGDRNGVHVWDISGTRQKLGELGMDWTDE